MLTIAVLGANGKSGKIFVETALAHGCKVRAGVYGKHDFTKHKNLKVIECDGMDEKSVDKLIKGSDVVVSLVGHTRRTPSNMQESTFQNIVSAMKKHQVKRVVSLTGTGVRVKGDMFTLSDFASRNIIKLIDNKRITDALAHYDILKKSKLDWTLLRVSRLHSKAPSRYIMRENGPAKSKVSRYEVADAILEVIDQNRFVRKSPIISRHR
jgi:putative NADH-flavin reductase